MADPRFFLAADAADLDRALETGDLVVLSDRATQFILMAWVLSFLVLIYL